MNLIENRLDLNYHLVDLPHSKPIAFFEANGPRSADLYIVFLNPMSQYTLEERLPETFGEKQYVILA